MKKIAKILISAACFTAIGTGTMFARERGEYRKINDSGRRIEIEKNDTLVRPVDLIGKVSSVDEKAGTLTVADMDGKETVMAISPFTRINAIDSRDDITISDIKKNAWIMYSLFNTETERKVASRVYVKNN